MHGAFKPFAGGGRLATAPIDHAPFSPNRLRWDPLPMNEGHVDFVDGMVTFTDLSIDQPGGGFALDFSDSTSALTGVTSAPFGVSAGPVFMPSCSVGVGGSSAALLLVVFGAAAVTLRRRRAR